MFMIRMERFTARRRGQNVNLMMMSDTELQISTSLGEVKIIYQICNINLNHILILSIIRKYIFIFLRVQYPTVQSSRGRR